MEKEEDMIISMKISENGHFPALPSHPPSPFRLDFKGLGPEQGVTWSGSETPSALTLGWSIQGSNTVPAGSSAGLPELLEIQ